MNKYSIFFFKLILNFLILFMCILQKKKYGSKVKETVTLDRLNMSQVTVESYAWLLRVHFVDQRCMVERDLVELKSLKHLMSHILCDVFQIFQACAVVSLIFFFQLEQKFKFHIVAGASYSVCSRCEHISISNSNRNFKKSFVVKLFRSKYTFLFILYYLMNQNR